MKTPQSIGNLLLMHTFKYCSYLDLYTVNVERFSGLNIRGFNPIKVFAEIYFSVALTRSAYTEKLSRYS